MMIVYKYMSHQQRILGFQQVNFYKEDHIKMNKVKYTSHNI